MDDDKDIVGDEIVDPELAAEVEEEDEGVDVDEVV